MLTDALRLAMFERTAPPSFTPEQYGSLAMREVRHLMRFSDERSISAGLAAMRTNPTQNFAALDGAYQLARRRAANRG